MGNRDKRRRKKKKPLIGAIDSVPENTNVDPTHAKTSDKGYATDQLGNIRRTPKLGELPISFRFEEVNGVKRLVQFSNSTASAVLLEAPLIELDLFNAREFVNRKNKQLAKQSAVDVAVAPTVQIVKEQFPRLANWFYGEEIKQTVFERQHESVRDCVVQVISDRLHLSTQTVDRYWRGRPLRKAPRT